MLFDCRFITVRDDDLPVGHVFVLVRRGSSWVAFVANTDQAHLQVRIALLEWERVRPTVVPAEPVPSEDGLPTGLPSAM